MIASRRKAREAAVRALYMMEIGGSTAAEAVIDVKAQGHLPPELFYFFESLVRGYDENYDLIDDRISRFLKDWTLDRLATVDRNVLRVACYELLFEDDIPPAVTINEAIDIVKKYNTVDSGKFVNGVLGSILADTNKAHFVITDETEEAPPEAEEEPVVEEVTPEEAEEAKVGFWKIRKEKDISDSSPSEGEGSAF